MAKKNTSKDPPPDCHHFDYRKKRKYLIVDVEKEVLKKSDPRYRQWPNAQPTTNRPKGKGQDHGY